MRCHVAFVVIAIALSGCDRHDQEIKVYRVSKAPLEAPAENAQLGTATSATAPPIASSRASAGFAAAAAPANWQPQPVSEMRQASYLITAADGTSADVSLVTLGGAAGNVLDNVNRWLNQLGQPPVTPEQLQKMIERVPAGGTDAVLVDLRGLPDQGDPKKDGRILGAIVSGEDSTSFFKMRGNVELIGAEKENFVNWIKASLSKQSQAKL